MKKFNFELQDILDYRNFEQEEAEMELGKALAVENEIENNLKILANQYADLKQRMKGSTNIEDIISQSQFNNLLEYQKEELLKQLTEAKLVTEEKRKILTEVMKKTTALEKLKEEQQNTYIAEQKEIEKKKNDDLNSRRKINK